MGLVKHGTLSYVDAQKAMYDEIELVYTSVKRKDSSASDGSHHLVIELDNPSGYPTVYAEFYASNKGDMSVRYGTSLDSNNRLSSSMSEHRFLYSFGDGTDYELTTAVHSDSGIFLNAFDVDTSNRATLAIHKLDPLWDYSSADAVDYTYYRSDDYSSNSLYTIESDNNIDNNTGESFYGLASVNPDSNATNAPASFDTLVYSTRLNTIAGTNDLLIWVENASVGDVISDSNSSRTYEVVTSADSLQHPSNTDLKIAVKQ